MTDVPAEKFVQTLESIRDIDHKLKALAAVLGDMQARLHDALVGAFGGSPDQLLLTSRDHLTLTTSMVPFMRLLPAWADIERHILAREAERKTWLDAGEDPRMKEDKKEKAS